LLPNPLIENTTAEKEARSELVKPAVHEPPLPHRWKFLRSVATLSAGTTAAQVLNITVAPILTRLYKPADLGVLGLFISFLSVACVGTALKYELGIVSARNENEATRLTWAALLLSVPTSLIAGAVLYVAIRGSYFGFGTLPKYAVPLMIGILCLTGIFTALRYWALRQEGFSAIAKMTISQQSVRAGSQVGFGLVSSGPGGLLIAELLGRFAGCVSLFRRAWPSLKRFGMRASRAEIRESLTHNRELAIYSLPSSFIDTFAANMAVPMIVTLFGASAGGQYALVQRVLAVPIVLIATSVADTFHSRLAVCVREEPQKMLGLFKRASLGLFFAGLVPAVLIALGGKKLFVLVFGTSWGMAGTLAAISTPFFLCEMVVSPLSRLVFVLRGQRSKLIYDLVLLAGILITFKIARLHALSLVQTVSAITAVNTVAYIVYFLVLVRIVVKSSTGTSVRQESQ
jgi:lipopolysaccharide exporter